MRSRASFSNGELSETSKILRHKGNPTRLLQSETLTVVYLEGSGSGNQQCRQTKTIWFETLERSTDAIVFSALLGENLANLLVLAICTASCSRISTGSQSE